MYPLSKRRGAQSGRLQTMTIALIEYLNAFYSKGFESA